MSVPSPSYSPAILAVSGSAVTATGADSANATASATADMAGPSWGWSNNPTVAEGGEGVKERLPVGRQELRVAEEALPRPELPGDEHTGRVERVVAHQLLGGLLAVRLVDDQRPGLVGERPGAGQLAGLEESGQVRPVRGAVGLDRGGV